MIIPCIDLMGGKVVQLVQGETLALERTADEAVALFHGFPLLHIIDLDAAKRQGENLAMIRELLMRIDARVGGGVRTVEQAEALIDAGAKQIIIGSAAFSEGGINEPLLQELVSRIGIEKIVIAVDCKAGKVAVAGWRESLSLTPIEAIRLLEPHCSAFLCTYVDREGMLQGTDLDLFRSLKQSTSRAVIAAGGITTMEEIHALVESGIEVALGMAIYTGRLNLEELRQIVRGVDP